jgi:hypothetical protein
MLVKKKYKSLLHALSVLYPRYSFVYWYLCVAIFLHRDFTHHSRQHDNNTLCLTCQHLLFSHEWHPWLFSNSRVPASFWDSKHNRYQYVKWYSNGWLACGYRGDCSHAIVFLSDGSHHRFTFRSVYIVFVSGSVFFYFSIGWREI